MKKIHLGILLGAIIGIIDLIPMIIQKLTWNANLSAFTFWIVAGLVIATSNIRLKGALKGLTISFILLVPLAFLIGWEDPQALLPVILLNLLFGSLLGYVIEKWGR